MILRHRGVYVALVTAVCLAGITACSDSKRLSKIEAACLDAGKFSVADCRCIAEGAADSNLSDLGITWLEAQFAADEDDESRLSRGVSNELLLSEYIKYSDRILQPMRFCETQGN